MFPSSACVASEQVGLEELGTTIVRGVAEMSASMARWLGLVDEFNRREGWVADGARSMVHWLSWRCGIDARTARAHVRVAALLAGLSLVREAFAAGRLSYSKVRSVCRVANADNQALLVELASNLTATQLDHAIARYQVATTAPVVASHGDGDGTGDGDGRPEARGVRTWTDEHGLHHTEIVSLPEEGALIDAAIDGARDERFRDSKTADAGAGGALDALLWVLRRGMVNAERPDLDDDSPYTVVVHVKEASALVGDDGVVELENGLRLDPATLQRLACDSVLQALVVGVDGRPLDLGRRVRTANRKQRRALRAMYPTCQFPGCDVSVRYCEFHHLDHWGFGGRSDLHVFRPLCRRHHHLVHEGGWTLAADALGGLAAMPPDERRTLVNAPPLTDTPLNASPLGGWTPEDAALDWLGGRWRGEPMNNWALGAIIDNLFAAASPRTSSDTDVDHRVLTDAPRPSLN